MVYLPVPNGTQTVQVRTDSYGKQVGIEVFDGFIQPGELTDWWTRHNLVTRSPATTAYGTIDPSLTWKPQQSGYYTLVIVLRQYWDKDARLELAVTTEVQNNSTSTR